MTFWGFQLLSYLGFDLASNYPFYVTWAAAIGVEPLAAVLRYIGRPATNSFGYSLLALQAFRLCVLVSLVGFPLILCRRRRTKGVEDEESQRLLPPEDQEQEQEQEPARQRRQSSKSKSYGATERQNDAKAGGDASSGAAGTGGSNQANGGDSSTPKPPDKASWWTFSKRLRVSSKSRPSTCTACELHL